MLRNFQAAGSRSWKAWVANLLCIASAAAAPASPASAVAGTTASRPATTGSAVSQRLALRHLEMLAIAAKARTDEALCAAVASANQTQESLGMDLQRRRDSIVEKPPNDAAALERLEQSAKDAQAQLPGVGLSIGAEGVYHYIRYGALAPYAPSGSTAGRALRLFDHIWSDRSGEGAYFEPTTDITGCMRPSSLVPALRELAAAWPSVSSCLKSQLRPKLLAGVDELMNWTCYCESESATTSALKEITLLANVIADGGAGAASSTTTFKQGPEARTYACR